MPFWCQMQIETCWTKSPRLECDTADDDDPSTTAQGGGSEVRHKRGVKAKDFEKEEEEDRQEEEEDWQDLLAMVKEFGKKVSLLKGQIGK